jgi:hypothetical protein
VLAVAGEAAAEVAARLALRLVLVVCCASADPASKVASARVLKGLAGKNMAGK